MKKSILMISLFAFFTCLIILQTADADWEKGRDIYGRIKMTSGTKTAEIDTSIAKNETMIMALGDTVSFEDNNSDDVDAVLDGTNFTGDDMPLRFDFPGDKTYTTVGPKQEAIYIYDYPAAIPPPDPCFLFNEGPLTVNANILVLWAWYDYDLWWFNGESPANYHVTITVTAQGATTGTFKWQVIAGGDKVNLNNGGDDSDTIIATDDNTVVVKSTAPSTSLNDVTIRFTYNNVFVQDLSLTVRAPDNLEHLNDDDDDWGDGWRTTISYRIRDQFNQVLPQNVPWNEDIDGNGQYSNDTTVSNAAVSDWEGENWPWGQENGVITNPNNAQDVFVRSGASATPPTENPHGGNVKVDHVPQGKLRVGSATIGRGVIVRNLVWQTYRDHGRHE